MLKTNGSCWTLLYGSLLITVYGNLYQIFFTISEMYNFNQIIFNVKIQTQTNWLCRKTAVFWCLWNYSGLALNYGQFCKDASGFTALRQVQSTGGPHSHPGLRPPLEHRFTTSVTYLITFGHQGELDSVFPLSLFIFYNRVGQQMYGLVCSHMQEESLVLNMGLYVLIQRDKLIDTNGGIHTDDFGWISTRERLKRNISWEDQLSTLVYPSHVYRNMRKPSAASRLSLSSYEIKPSFLYIYSQTMDTWRQAKPSTSCPKDTQPPMTSLWHLDLLNVIQTCSKRHTFPLILSIAYTDKTTCQTSQFEMFEQQQHGRMSRLEVDCRSFFS